MNLLGACQALILAQNRLGINHELWQMDFGRHPTDELYDLAHDPDCLINLAQEKAQTAKLDAMRTRLFAELRAQHDPRMAGQGAIFDRYPYADPKVRNFYNRMMHDGERIFPFWADKNDFAAPGFDPELPPLAAGKSNP